MASKRGSIWTENELRKEQIRATLAVGAIAVVYYLRQAFQILLEINLPSNLLTFLGDQTAKIDLGLILVNWFGLYVLATVVAVSDDMTQRYLWKEICGVAKSAGRGCYLVAAAFVCLPVVLSTVSLLVDSPVLVGIPLLIIAFSLYARWRRTRSC